MLDIKKLILKLLNAVKPESMRDALYPVGSCYTTSTNTNPSTIFGGMWELIDKQFASEWITTGFTWNTTNTSSGAFVCLKHGHTIELRFGWSNKKALSDDTVAIGTWNCSSILTNGEHTGYFVGYCDALNATLLMSPTNIETSSWTFQMVDAVTRATSYPTGTGEGCRASYMFNVRTDHMNDSACNQFIWKRTA